MKHANREMIAASVLILGICLAANGQRPSEVVKWSASIMGTTSSSPFAMVTATILGGWHIYALSQSPGGPTPLKISIPVGSSFALSGPVPETKVSRRFDSSFNMETIFYIKTATLHLPLKETGAAVADELPIDVRFQACNDKLCLPPYTVHLSVDLKRR